MLNPELVCRRRLGSADMGYYLEPDLRKKLKAVCKIARSDCNGCIGLPAGGKIPYAVYYSD